MKKVSKLLALLLAAMMVLSLAACSSDEPAEEEAEEDPAVETTTEGEEEAAKPGEGKSYVIYSDNAFAPFEFYGETEQAYIGVDMDLLAAIAEDQGFSYEVKNEGFDAAMGAVQAGQADAMIAGMTITEERAETFDFSDGYFEDGQIMVVAADSDIASLDDIKDAKVAAKIGTMSTKYVDSIKDEYNLTVSNLEDSPTMYNTVIGGNADVCFEDRSVVAWAIKERELALKTVGDVIEPREYGFAVKKGENAELLEMFNAGLKNIRDNGTYDEILAKYGY